MAEPIRALELHYPMIQFLIIDLIHDTRHLCTCFGIAGIKAMSHGISGGQISDKTCHYKKWPSNLSIVLK